MDGIEMWMDIDGISLISLMVGYLSIGNMELKS
jgi:hypothetical protein